MEILQLCFQTYKHYLTILLLKLEPVQHYACIVSTGNIYAQGMFFSKKRLKFVTTSDLWGAVDVIFRYVGVYVWGSWFVMLEVVK